MATIRTNAPVHGEALFLCVIHLHDDSDPYSDGLLAHGFGDTEESAIEATTRQLASDMEDLLDTGPYEAKRFVAGCIEEGTYIVRTKAN